MQSTSERQRSHNFSGIIPDYHNWASREVLHS